MSVYHQFHKNPWVVFVYLFNHIYTDSYAHSFPPYSYIYLTVGISLYKSNKLEYLLLDIKSWVLPLPFCTPKVHSASKGLAFEKADSQVNGG